MIDEMIVIAITLLAVGSFGVGAAVFLEMRTHESKYKIMMKVFPWVFGVGGILLAVALTVG